MIDPGSVDAFFDSTHIAVVGASDDPKRIGSIVFRALMDHGCTVIPVNPAHDTVDAMTCYPDLASIPATVDAVLVMVPAEAALGVVEEAAAAGVGRVWLFKGLGNRGALSDEAVAACERHGMDVIAGACPLMFLEPVGGFHRFHRALRHLNHSVARAA
jgi:predicted CoA-binding protein